MNKLRAGIVPVIQHNGRSVHVVFRQISEKIVVAVDAGAVKFVGLPLIFIGDGRKLLVGSLPKDMGQRNIVDGIFHVQICQHRRINHHRIQQQPLLGLRLRHADRTVRQHLRITDAHTRGQGHILSIQKQRRDKLFKQMRILILPLQLTIRRLLHTRQRFFVKFLCKFTVLIQLKGKQINHRIVTFGNVRHTEFHADRLLILLHQTLLDLAV